MYLYRFYSWDYECPLSIILSNKKLYSEDEFEKIVRESYDEAKIICDKNKEILDKLNDESTFSDEEINEMLKYSNEDDYIKKTLNILKEKYEFLDLEPIYTFAFVDGFYGIEEKLVNKVIK